MTLTSSDAAVAEAIREPVPSAVWVGAWGGLALFVAASAGAGLRTGAFPRWLSLTSLLLAAAFLVSLAIPTSAVGEVADLVLWLWIVAASTVLYRRGTLPSEASLGAVRVVPD